MTALELMRNQKANKPKSIIKVSNNYIEGFVSKASVAAVKILFYLARAEIKGTADSSLVSFKIDTKDLLSYCNIDLVSLRKTIMSLQKTSVIVANDSESFKTYSLIPKIEFIYGRNTLEVSIFKEVHSLIKEVKNKYTAIDTRNFMRLRFKHSLKMIQLLSRLSGYDEFVAKRKYYSLDEINLLFGTNYKNCSEIARRILKPCKAELDTESNLTFIYETEFSHIMRGRPKAKGFTIDVIKNNYRQPKLF